MSQLRFTDNSENELYSVKNLNGKSAAITKNADSELHLLEFGIVTDVWSTLESANYLNVYTS